MITKEILKRSFWALPAEECLNMLETTTFGLSHEDVNQRSSFFGVNKLPEKGKITKLKIFMRQFKNPFIILLLISGTITLFLEDFKDTIFILAAAFVNAVLGFYQENKAEEALDHLRTYIEKRVRVFRDNRELEVDVTELVPGDIIHLSQGDRIPADGRIIYANDLQVDQSILTGESLPVPKSVESMSFETVLADQQSMIFSGTVAVQGFGNAVVTATGRHTEIGKIALLVGRPEREKTPLQGSVARLSWRIGFFLLGLTALIFGLGVYSGQSVFDMFLIAVAMAVSAVPEGLPVVLTVILAIGVQRLAGKRGIVRKLLAAETLGSTSIVLTDKTGTLTQAKMDLSRVTVFSDHDKGENISDKIIELAIVNSDVVIENPNDLPDNWQIIGRPLEIAAVKAAARRNIILPKLKKDIKVVDYLPFSSANKFSASIIKYNNDDRYLLSLFGAPEIILKYADLTPEERKRVLSAVDKMAYGGDRVLSVAVKKLTSKVSLSDRNNFQGADFLGTISFRDPVRSEVKDAMERVTSAGVKVVIITGDHMGTAVSVAREIGFVINPDQVIDGTELESLSDEVLKSKLDNLKIVSRISPQGKLRILKAYQASGATVAMTGDGINDAPTLKEADIGVGMGSGSDVAKDVADLVLLDDNFETIVEAINEGRRILANIRKAIVYLLSDSLDAVILIGGALALGLGMPLNPLQILWVNFFTDSFPGIALAFEDGHDRLGQKPPKIPKGLLDSEMKFLIMIIGVLTSVLLLIIYAGLTHLGFEEKLVNTFTFTVFGTYTLFAILAVRSLSHSIFSINLFSNPYIIFSILLGFVLMAVAVYVPFFQGLLGTITLPPSWLWGVAIVSFINIALIEFGKWIYRNK
ncbi:MAG: cation-transporting P-type ATPase [bacterium]|nr:cation-transporting P-type ATPase [bacterium]